MTASTFSSAAPTLGSALDLAKGRPAGFDYMRLLLSIAVLAWHTILMTQGVEVQNENINNEPFRAFPLLILPMFFALSGFLVAGSLDRAKNIVDFACLRVLRLLPALCLVVVLSAVVMGPLVTSYPLGEYFSDSRFSHYFLTILGNIQEQLPGVFENNPFPGVINGQLWTIPIELECYLILIIPAVLGIYKRPRLFLAFVLVAQLAFAVRAIGWPVIYGGVPPRVLIMCFLAGVVMSMYRHKIPYRLDLACLCTAVAFALVYIPGGNYFLAFPAAYLTAYLGLMNPKKNWWVSSGDYSYGVYLFAFPIQQIVASIPSLPQVWYVNLLVSLPLVMLMALFSWWVVEKPALSHRHHIPKVHAGLVKAAASIARLFGLGRPAADGR